MSAPRLSEAQRAALARGSVSRWQDAATVNVNGPAFVALERRGLADVRRAGDVGLRGDRRRLVYRLTPAGVQLDLELSARERQRTLVYRLTPAGVQLDLQLSARRRAPAPAPEAEAEAEGYRVHLLAYIEHVDGPVPEWRAAADAVAAELAGETVELQVGGRRVRLLVDDVEVDEADEVTP